MNFFIHQFRNMLRAKQFDTAIDMQSLLKSGRSPWLSGAPGGASGWDLARVANG